MAETETLVSSRGTRAAVAFVASLGTVVVGYLVNVLTGLITASWARHLPLILTVAVVAAVVVAGLSAWAAGHRADPTAGTATAAPPRSQHGRVQIGEVSGGVVVGQANGPVGPGAQQIINLPAQPADQDEDPSEAQP